MSGLARMLLFHLNLWKDGSTSELQCQKKFREQIQKLNRTHVMSLLLRWVFRAELQCQKIFREQMQKLNRTHLLSLLLRWVFRAHY